MPRPNFPARLARRFIERARALELKGKARDHAAMHYFVGAAAVLEEAGLTDASQHVAVVTMLALAPRGYREIETLAALPVDIADKPAT